VNDRDVIFAIDAEADDGAHNPMVGQGFGPEGIDFEPGAVGPAASTAAFCSTK
jgi:hypothetical protein